MGLVFLCHSVEDKPAVRELRRRLISDGVTPWFDEEDLLPGQEWELEIPKVVRTCAAVVVCLSQRAIEKTGYVHKEVRRALEAAEQQPEGKIFVIPARLEECEIPERLRHLHWVNLFEPDGYGRLLRALGATARPPSSKLRFTVHAAQFVANGLPCFFLNVTNLAATEVEVTHAWFATEPQVFALRPERPLPKRLKPMETWETWVRIDEVPGAAAEEVYEAARVRLSTGEIVHSRRNDGVPEMGSVPGGSIFH